jgi:predicted transcriptional regulator
MGDNGSVLVQFRASKALVEQADLLAEAQGLSRSAIARRALLRDLRAHEAARSIVMPTVGSA